MPRPDASERLAATRPKDNGRTKIVIIGVLVVALIVGAFAAVLISSRGSSQKATPPRSGVAGGNGVVVGSAKAGAPAVDLYEDFQCPNCKTLEDANGTQIAQLAQQGKIKLTVHMMSFLDANNGNDSSVRSAAASFCAADAGKFIEFHHQVFANQPPEGVGYTDAKLKEFGRKAGISGAAATTFDACVSNRKYLDYAKDTEARSGKNGITSTPSILVNGKAIPNAERARLMGEPGSAQSVLLG